MSQVWAIDDVTTSIIINIMVLLASPLLFTMCTIGAVIGSFLGTPKWFFIWYYILNNPNFPTPLGVAFLPIEEVSEVYSGLWGYNALLTMGAISCVFFAFNHQSFLMGLVATAATSVVQFALRVNMTGQVKKTDVTK